MSQSTVYRFTSSGEVDTFAEKSHDNRVFSFLAYRSHKDSSYKFDQKYRNEYHNLLFVTHPAVLGEIYCEKYSGFH